MSFFSPELALILKGIRKKSPTENPPSCRKALKNFVKTNFSKLLQSICDIFQECKNILRTEMFGKNFVWKKQAPLNLSCTKSLKKLFMKIPNLFNVYNKCINRRQLRRLVVLLDPRPWLEVSYKIGSVCPILRTLDPLKQFFLNFAQWKGRIVTSEWY